jgi:hypothetical protein
MMAVDFAWPTFFALWAAGLAGLASVIPYALAAQGAKGRALSKRLFAVVSLQFLLNALVVGLAVALGLVTAREIGLGAPLTEQWLAGGGVGLHAWTVIMIAVPSGLATGVAVVVLETAVFLRRLPREEQRARIPHWMKLLASLYGPTTEELLLRLFLFSLVAWALGLAWGAPYGAPAPGALWTTNVIVALAFGVGHLPALRGLMPLTRSVVVRTLTLNGLASLVFGYLYWHHGIEAAALAHLTANSTIHLLSGLLPDRS